MGEGITALGVIRCLGRSGIPVLAANDRTDISFWSRWHEKPSNYPHGPFVPGQLSELLAGLPIERSVLMPCSDLWVQEVAELDNGLKSMHLSWTPESSAVSSLVDKNLFRRVMLDAELPHPRTYDIRCSDDIERIPDEMFEQAFLKPHLSQAFLAAYQVKGIFTKSKEEARKHLSDITTKRLQVVLQEYISGPPTNHFFVDGFRPRECNTTRYLARQRLRMYPQDFGNSTDMVTVPLDRVAPAIETLECLFDAIEYHGIFSAEFKLDERDNLFKLLEVNCRPWWYIEYADVCGLHVCKYAYQEALSQELDQFAGYELHKRGVYPMTDWASWRASDPDESESVFELLRKWIQAHQPIFSLQDPVPSLVNFCRLLKGAVARRIA